MKGKGGSHVRTLRLGTRGSQLALYQANTTAALLARHAGVTCEIVVIKTSGDRLAEAPLSEVGGKRLFVKEIEDALLAGDVDLAVHSSKDMPAVLPQGLDIAAVLEREDPRDAIVLPGGGESLTVEQAVSRLGDSPRIGTSSVRRSAQLTRLFPGASFSPIRGNLDTRLRKVDQGQFSAIVLAAAGLRRLEQGHRISASLPAGLCVPAPGQGIIAIEIRAGDAAVRQAVSVIDNAAARVALDAERAVVTRLGGGCQMPIGAYADVSGRAMTMVALVATPDGARILRADRQGTTEAAAALGAAAADDLLAQGAAEILAEVERTNARVEGLQP
ncbi:MAG: hydroxymethylbilane synthase [Vicinamibacterales bacterium]